MISPHNVSGGESRMHMDIDDVCIHTLSSQGGKKERVSTR